MSHENNNVPILSRIALSAARAIPKFSRKPWVCIISAAVGLVIGLKNHRLAENLAPVGELYMTLLTLTVTPIIFSALATGIASLFSSGEGRRYIGRTMATLVIGALVAGFLGTFAGTVVLPFFSNLEDKEFVGAMLSKFEDASNAGAKGPVRSRAWVTGACPTSCPSWPLEGGWRCGRSPAPLRRWCPGVHCNRSRGAPAFDARH